MATLAAWRFDTADAAGHVAHLLAGREAAIVEWLPGDRRPHAREIGGSDAVTGALDDGFWGLLFGLVFFVPLLGAAIGAATGAVAGGLLSDVGIDDHFVNRLRDRVTPGTSAVIALTDDDVVDRLNLILSRGRRPELIHAHLAPEQEAALRTVFGR